jgi:hypothetical protein
MNNKFYDVYYSLKDETRHAPLERVFRDCFVKDLFHYDEDLEKTRLSLKARDLNINIYEIKEADPE